MTCVDSHCHLADPKFAADLEAVVARAREAGLAAALCILSADEPDEIARVPAIRAAWPDVQFSTGVHPHRATAYAGRVAEAAAIVTSAIERVGACAVGEIGLDYHYDVGPKTVQREVFAAQVAVAIARDLPVVIHTREAASDTIDVLRAAGPSVRGVMHCFTGTIDEARASLDVGFYISISGIATFPKSDALRDVAAFVPLDRLLVETDAPYLAPVPHRGARNEPAWTVETLKAVARVRGLEPEALGEAVSANFRRLFGGVTRMTAR
jgi:TatD DNase family protein